jgi:tRNA dimethylallyltransferase
MFLQVPSPLERAMTPLAIIGPTCSGKSSLAMAIAERQDCEIVSADSRQCYRGMDIGTAKPTQEQRLRVPHHFIDIAEPNEPWSAGQFGDEAARVVSAIQSRNTLPLIVGGSTLYVRALIDGLFDGPEANPDVRAALEARAHEEGVQSLLEELHAIDPTSIVMMRTPTIRRVVRALEVFRSTGTTITEWRSRRIARPFSVTQFALQWDRTELYGRINARVDEMMRDGLQAEVRALAARGFTEHTNALNSPGYAELFPVLRGEQPLERAVVLIQQHTRNYAKRQITWFGADARIQWIPVDGKTEWGVVAEKVITIATTQ